jgi:excisionase family DNA binding protein
VQEYLNLDEAAEQLQISKEELSKKAQRREIRAFADRGTWKFRKQDIEEHARQAGIGSGAEIVFGDLEDELPSLDSGSSDQILLSDQALADSPSGSSGKRVIGMDEFGRTPSDSDVRLVPEAGAKKGSDSDVKLVGGKKPPSDSDVKVIAAGEAGPADSDVKMKGPAPGDSDVRLDRVKAPSDSGIRIADSVAPSGTSEVTQDLPVFTGLDEEGLAITSGSSGEQPIAGEPDSDSELSAGVDADSDFELGAAAGAAATAGDSDMTLALDDNIGLVPDEIKLAPKGPSDSDVTAGSPSSSGVNLSSPADSGIALDAAPPAAGRSGRGMGVTEGPSKPASDIFETDFEVPVLDSDQEIESSSSSDTEQLSPDSDFELSGSDLEREAETDSASQVLSLEGEEQVDEAAATRMQAAPQEDEQWEEDLQGEESAEFAQESGMVGTPSRAMESMPEDSGAVSPALAPAGAGEAEWGGLWVGTLCFTTVVMLLLGMVMFDLVRTMWGWEGGTIFYQSPMLNWMSNLVPKG